MSRKPKLKYLRTLCLISNELSGNRTIHRNYMSSKTVVPKLFVHNSHQKTYTFLIQLF
uniref:Uncharacterized protein n=1 Tax=Lepeophtheirus salmonis TaxID=72036 RepID=A0A0K2VK69_LEPSM